MVTSLDSNLLLSIYNSRLPLAPGQFASATGTSNAKVAPTAPWSKLPTPQQSAADASAAVKSALAGHKFVDENNAQLDLPNASQDYRKLFALYQGLATLGDLAAQAQKKGVTGIELKRLQETFAKGMKEVASYVGTADLDKVRLTAGEVASTAKTTAPVQATKSEYVTAPVYAGTSSDSVPAFQGNVSFTISVKRSGTVHNVSIDLSEMGAQTRSMANVTNYINDKLAAEGIDTRFATQRLPGAPRTTQAGGNRGRGMGRAKGIVFALAALGETRQSAALAQGAHAGTAAGDDLVGIGLMTDVPDHPVLGSFEHVVQGGGQFDYAKTGAEMPARHRNDVDQVGAQFVGELPELMLFQLAQVLWQINLVQQGCLGIGDIHDRKISFLRQQSKLMLSPSSDQFRGRLFPGRPHPSRFFPGVPRQISIYFHNVISGPVRVRTKRWNLPDPPRPAPGAKRWPQAPSAPPRSSVLQWPWREAWGIGMK
jgi:hypothetical protein